MTDDARRLEAEPAGFADRPVFSAVITPHRSLGPKGVAILLGGFATVSAVVSVPFVLVGAWPIVGFFGLDVLLLWLALRASFAQARAYERIVLTHIDLTIRKVTHRGSEQEWRFNPLWVRLESEADEEFGMTGLFVRERQARLDVGAALSPDERADFAHAFGSALAAAKAGPRFPLDGRA